MEGAVEGGVEADPHVPRPVACLQSAMDFSCLYPVFTVRLMHLFLCKAFSYILLQNHFPRKQASLFVQGKFA